MMWKNRTSSTGLHGTQVIKHIVETDIYCGDAWCEYIVLHFELGFSEHAKEMFSKVTRIRGMRLGCANVQQFKKKVEVRSLRGNRDGGRGKREKEDRIRAVKVGCWDPNQKQQRA